MGSKYSPNAINWDVLFGCQARFNKHETFNVGTLAKSQIKGQHTRWFIQVEFSLQRFLLNVSVLNKKYVI